MSKIDGAKSYLIWFGTSLVILVISSIIIRFLHLPEPWSWLIMLLVIPVAIGGAAVLTFVIAKKLNK